MRGIKCLPSDRVGVWTPQSSTVHHGFELPVGIGPQLQMYSR